MSLDPKIDPLINPWQPITHAIDLKHLGKLAEEVNELGAAIARCIIQGIDEFEPVTGKTNREWLMDEIADVRANVALCVNHFKLDDSYMDSRMFQKVKLLQKWHNMIKEKSNV